MTPARHHAKYLQERKVVFHFKTVPSQGPDRNINDQYLTRAASSRRLKETFKYKNERQPCTLRRCPTRVQTGTTIIHDISLEPHCRGDSNATSFQLYLQQQKQSSDPRPGRTLYSVGTTHFVDFWLFKVKMAQIQ